MPKVNDPLCPLGFHPQTRWPNRCKRCFRDLNEHLGVKDSKSGSNTSLNSLSSYDSNTKLTSFNKARPTSWSAQDLRAAVDEAKEQIRSSREDLHRLYGSTKSLTGQDLGGSNSDLSKDMPSYTSFSSYLAMRTKSPARPPLDRSGSLHGTASTSASVRLAEEEEERQIKALEKELETNKTNKTNATDSIARSSLLSSSHDKDSKLSKSSSSSSSSSDTIKKSPLSSILEGKKTLSSIAESKKISLSSLVEGKKNSDDKKKISLPTIDEPTPKKSILSSDGKPPKPPSRLKTSSSKLGDISEGVKEEKPRPSILSLRDDFTYSTPEVKSEDDSVDASYVVSLKPKKDKKETKKVEIDLQSELDRVNKELKEKISENKEMEQRMEQLERENKDLSTKKSLFGSDRRTTTTDVTRLQQKVDDLTEEMKGKNKEIKELKKEIDKRPLPKDIERAMEDLRSKLQAAEQLCEELMDENEEYKKDVKCLEDEVEEMQDNFREEQADEYRDLKRELEQTAKNCRVLQFKLKKAERRSDLLEKDKGEIEDKLKDLQVGDDEAERAERIKLLEKEVNLAKEVSMKMHDEMGKMKKQLDEAEKDKIKLTEKCKDVPMRPGGKYSRAQMMGRQGSMDNTEQLMRDLEQAGERENDLKDQLKFAEEETKNLRKKLSRVEEENETLALQLKKMSNKAKAERQRSLERSSSHERTSSVERGQLSRQGSLEKPSIKEPDEGITEDLDPTELKIQLELNEQESAVLRRKVEDLESENMRLQKEIKGVLSSSDMRTKKGGDGLTEELRTKISEIEKENEKLLDENKRLQLKTTKRLPLSSNESTYIEKQVLEDKVRRLEKKLKTANENLKAAQNAAAGSTGNDIAGKTKGSNDIGSDALKRDINDKENEISKLKALVQETQEKYDKISKDNQDMKDSSAYKQRTPKKPKDLTPKSTLIKWVDELESECAKLHVALMEAEKKKKPGRPSSEDLTNLRDLEDKLEREKERNDELTTQLKEERQKQDNQNIPNRNKAGILSTGGTDSVRKLEKELEDLRKELTKEKEKGSTGGFDHQRSVQTEKHKLQKELASEQEKITILEKKLKEAEENLKLSERAEKKAKSTLDKLEIKLEDEKQTCSQAEDRQRELAASWLKEREEMRNELIEHKKAKEKAERDLRVVKKARDALETKLDEEKRRLDDTDKKKKRDADEVKTLKKENRDLSVELDDLKDTCRRMEKVKDSADTKLKKELDNMRSEKEGLEIRMNTLESELKTEQRKRERLEKEKEKEKSSSSLLTYKENARKAEEELKTNKKELKSIKQEYEEKITVLERQNEIEKHELEELHHKYELLEEEFVVQKAQLTTVKDFKGRDYETLKKDHDTIEQELKTLRETYNQRQDTWIKEKLDMQEQLKNLEDRFNKVSLDPASYSEKKRLKDIIDDKNQQLDRFRRDEDALKDQVSYYRRESDEMRRKLEDYEKLQEISHRKEASKPMDTSSYDNQIRDLRLKVTAMEKSHKTDQTKLKMKHDSKLKAMTEEVSTLTSHMTKYRRERDTYKEMLDGAQKSLAEYKGTSGIRASRADTAAEAQQNLQEKQDLQAQVTELEDKLADSKIGNAKIKNEMVDMKSSLEIQLCDMQTKLNEYEEDRLLGGGSRRVPGLRTRLELNWQKEREEQQRLITETATLAKDLRQTLYEVERERDLERLEAKRKIEQLKKTVGQETSDTKSKVQELQRDLLELREAHAKLRQINEKLRREKDRTEVEREAMRDKFLGSSREHLHQQTKMEKLMEDMKTVKDLAPLVLGEGLDGRDASLTRLPANPKPKTKDEFTDALKSACKTMDDMKKMFNLFDDKDRLKRAPSFRRALSDLDTDDEGPPSRPRSAQRGAIRSMNKNQRSNLYRKTQSLDHQMAEERGKIWVSTDAGSTTSIDSTMTDDMRRSKYERDISLDRISTGSQTSDLDSVTSEKKKKGLKSSVMSKFGKTKSIEESGTGSSIMGAGIKAMGVGVGSGTSIPEEVAKDSVKGKLKGFFKKGPPTRSQSMDRAEINSKTGRDYDAGSMASITSLESNASANVPPVMRRFKGRQSYGSMAKASSITAIGRQGSIETDV